MPCFSTSHSPGPPSFRPDFDQQVDRPTGGAGLRRQFQALGPPAEGREIRHRQVEAEQLEDRAIAPRSGAAPDGTPRAVSELS